MKIAVVTARNADGEAGGAERFYSALLQSLRSLGCDAVELPVVADESSFDNIKLNYLNCYDLDVSGFDRVVSTKAPTWLVRHPQHVCYLVHTIRVFYDMFDQSFSDAGPEHREQRDLVQRLDTAALSWPRCRKIFSIGHEVSSRLKTWNGLSSEVLHPPLWTDRFAPAPLGDYMLVPGRLHPWKRVDLVIRAMKLVRAPFRLVVTGTGELEDELKALAAFDSRIEFLGHVSDSELFSLYEGALCIPFVPLREDYGYITTEAMACGKPVITCTDSGEAAAIVESTGGGIVCQPVVDELAGAMERLWNDPVLAESLGKRGRSWVESLSWASIARRLVEASD